MKIVPVRLAQAPIGKKFRLAPPNVSAGESRLAWITSGSSSPSRYERCEKANARVALRSSLRSWAIWSSSTSTSYARISQQLKLRQARTARSSSEGAISRR